MQSKTLNSNNINKNTVTNNNINTVNKNKINNEYQMNNPFIMPTYMNYYQTPQYMFQQKPQLGMPYFYPQNQGNPNMVKPIFMPIFPMNINQVNNNNFINLKQHQYQTSEKSKK